MWSNMYWKHSRKPGRLKARRIKNKNGGKDQKIQK